MSGTQDTTPLQANSFNLSGRAIHVDFNSTSFSGQPTLTYHDTVQNRSFSGDEIQIVEVPALGMIVSVTLSIAPDVGSTSFSVLIPSVALSGRAPSPVTTDAVTTIHRTPFSARFVGQREVYTVTRMTGMASFMVF